MVKVSQRRWACGIVEFTNNEDIIRVKMPAPELPQPPRLSIRRSLIRIIVAALLPMGLFAGVLFYFLWDNQQTLRNQEQLARVKTMGVLVENEFQNVISRLQVIASDPLLDKNMLREFDARCRRLLAENPDWENLILLSPEKQLINVAAPYGTALPMRRPAAFQDEAFTTLRPTVSDLFISRVRGSEIVSIAVPVIRNGKAPYLLLVGLKRESFSEGLRKMIPPGGVASIYDGSLRIVARTLAGESNVGTLPGKDLLDAMRGAQEGAIRTKTREGLSVFTTWTKIANGWWIATGTPSAASDRALAQYAGLLALAWLAILLAGLVMARVFCQRLERSVEATIEVANELASGRAASFPQSDIRELAALSDAIATLFARERKARAESDAANTAKDEFLAMLGHELRNPIGAIANAVHIMDDEKRSASQDGMARRVIVRQTEMLKRIIDDLLDIGRALTGKINLDLQPLDLSACVTRAAETLAAAGKTARHRLNVNVMPVWIRGDAARIEQVLTNLISNAITHTPANGDIRISVAQDSGDAVITVRDTGMGIMPEALPRIFDLFYQEERRGDRPQGGLGIGLTLVRRLVELHGGTVTASSPGTGKGATFTVRIPATYAPANEAAPPALPDPVRSRRHKVLIVEDNLDARETLRAALELSGCDVQVAADGPAGIDSLNRWEPDTVIIDIGLPGMDGNAVAREIRARAGARVQLIALTGYGLVQDEEEARAAGFDAHLVKPADLTRLTALMQRSAP